MVRAALDSVDAQTPEPPRTEAATVADFETHYRGNLMRRLQGAPAGASKTRGFDRAALLATLARHRVPEHRAHELAEAAAKTSLTDMTLALAAAIDKRMTTAPIDFAAARAFLLAGPNGAGKTAVAAKLAAHASLAGRRTTLIAADSAGAGAVARLDAFAKHLDAAIAVAETAPQLSKLVGECLARKTFVVIDTAGFDTANRRPRSRHWARSRASKRWAWSPRLNDAEEVPRLLSALGAGRLIVTGLDLARRAVRCWPRHWPACRWRTSRARLRRRRAGAHHAPVSRAFSPRRAEEPAMSPRLTAIGSGKAAPARR